MPFRICSVVSVHAKPIGNYTEALKHLKDHGSKSKIIVEGPYGFKPNWKEFDVVVLFGAGIGATPWISLVRDFLLDADAKGPKYLYFILSVPNKAALSWFDDTWQLMQQTANPGLQVQRYVTREKGDEVDSIYYSRPDFNSILGKVSQEFHGKTKKALVMTCGPGIFSRGVQDAAFNLSSRNGIIFDFHDEVFKF
jgi:predicted ferric reductase